MPARRAWGIGLVAAGALLAAWCISLLLRPEIELGHVLATMGLGFCALPIGAGLLLMGRRLAGAVLLGAHVASGLLGWARLVVLDGASALVTLPVMLATGPALVVVDAPLVAAAGIVGGALVGLALARRKGPTVRA